MPLYMIVEQVQVVIEQLASLVQVSTNTGQFAFIRMTNLGALNLVIFIRLTSLACSFADERFQDCFEVGSCSRCKVDIGATKL